MSIRIYTAQSNQNIYDVCLMTYGTLDNFANTSYSALFKLMQDNDFPGVNVYPAQGQQFQWDDTLAIDQNVNVINATAPVVYATAAGKLGAAYYKVQEEGGDPVAPVSEAPFPGVNNGYFYVLFGDPNIGTDGSGHFTYTDKRLVGKSGYAVYSSQLSQMFYDDYISYNPTAGSFTINVPGFSLIEGSRIQIFLNQITL